MSPSSLELLFFIADLCKLQPEAALLKYSKFYEAMKNVFMPGTHFLSAV